MQTLLLARFLNGFSLLQTWVSFILSFSLCRCLSTIHTANDGHDTDVTFAGTWLASWLPPLLANPNFNDDRTLILLSRFHQKKKKKFNVTWSFTLLAFDETGTQTIQNNVASVLLGGVIPADLVGTTDSAFYTHYSELATVEANWNLPTLGRYDVGSNVYSFVAAQTGDTVRTLGSPSLAQTYLDGSYAGVYNSKPSGIIPVPNTSLVVNGRAVLPAIVESWGTAALQACTVYNGSLEIPSASDPPPKLPAGCWGVNFGVIQIYYRFVWVKTWYSKIYNCEWLLLWLNDGLWDIDQMNSWFWEPLCPIIWRWTWE